LRAHGGHELFVREAPGCGSTLRHRFIISQGVEVIIDPHGIPEFTMQRQVLLQQLRRLVARISAYCIEHVLDGALDSQCSSTMTAHRCEGAQDDSDSVSNPVHKVKPANVDGLCA
jgi:hypothetical protein